MKTLNANELKRMMDAGEIAVFDVRGDVKFEQGRIPGAMTAPMGSLTFRVVRVMNPDSAVAVYSEGDDDLAAQAAQRLQNMGMSNVHLFADGLKGWAAAGFEAPPAKHAKLHTQGPVEECRPLVVDRETAYGGAFKGKPTHTEAAGG